MALVATIKFDPYSIGTAFGLDPNLGREWTAGATSTVDNWWWYKGKVYVGIGTLAATPAAPFYPVRQGRTLHLSDFITTFGLSDILDVVDWQWAFDSAKLNIQAGYFGVLDMDAREYPVVASGYTLAQGVGFVGPTDAMMGGTLEGSSILYINFTPTAPLFTLYGHNEIRNFGVFYATQTYSTLAAQTSMNVLFRKLPDPSGTGSNTTNTKGCNFSGVSVCGGTTVWKAAYSDNAPGEYDRIEQVSATPSPNGPVMQLGISTDFLRIKSVHINGNVVSAYREKYGVDFSVRGMSSSNTNAIGFLIERMDGGTFEDVLVYGVPFPCVFGAVGATAGLRAAGCTFTACAFDAANVPFYVNAPVGAFGISAVNCQFIFDEQFGDTSGNLVYLGVGATNHQIMLSNCKVQYTASFTYRPVRAVSASTNNTVMITNSALAGYNAVLDEGTGNRISITGCSRNLNGVNLQRHITPDATPLSTMGSMNAMFVGSATVTISANTYGNVAVTFPYTGFASAPRVFCNVTSVSGIADSSTIGARAYSITSTGCTIRAATNVSTTGSVVVDYYVIGNVNGVLTAV